ncbi:hypothetical protein [Clostridium estertheticum]|uniref:hypothetical protein n=1 Tax=Clostridium estertheticum TaxID=238834 RepID=UPI001C0DF444|nr:hypothetical protein [Clostridium estertheticum]MBU3217030.1 hypothetical protein [Clostridium estertheticum]
MFYGFFIPISRTYLKIAMQKRYKRFRVSREAAYIILLDDNFSTNVDTIKDGRQIYDNIREGVSKYEFFIKFI